MSFRLKLTMKNTDPKNDATSSGENQNGIGDNVRSGSCCRRNEMLNERLKVEKETLELELQSATQKFCEKVRISLFQKKIGGRL